MKQVILLLSLITSFASLSDAAVQVKSVQAYSVQPKDGSAPLIVTSLDVLELKQACPRTDETCLVKFKGEIFRVDRSVLRRVQTTGNQTSAPAITQVPRPAARSVNQTSAPAITQVPRPATRPVSPANMRNSDLNFGATTCSCVYGSCRITSDFGPRERPNSRASSYHEGFDIGGGAGTPIVAAESGRIAFAGNKGGYGKTIDIRHTSTYTTRYGHMSRFKKTSGWVQKGEIIGYMGSTGNAEGPHLHFEILRNGEQVNPSSYVSTNRSDLSKECSEVQAIGESTTRNARAGVVE